MTEVLREYFDLFLLDTLLWTGGLIALVLLLRRPVAKYLGAGAAYALWALPALRMLFPPVTLPAWMAPAEEPVPTLASSVSLSEAPDMALGYYAALPEAAAVPVVEPVDLISPLIALWLLGAVVFLVRRFWLYAELRRELLDDAVPVGESGKVRLVETPAISGPMAFGVRDKVVALPVGFMTARDRRARDLAIAHELEHHRGHDLLANILVQPLFALHWFNPLGWMGWTALRRDQEAACDARVVASRPREERAVYAGVIADFARRPQAIPRPALAAPMACPVLGDKSIIQRLRNLSMSDVSSRRRTAGRAGIAAALFALPLTASIGYASASAQDAPLPPDAPSAPLPPDAPEALLPPEATAPPSDDDVQIKESWVDGKKRVVVIQRSKTDDGKEKTVRRIITGDAREMTAEDRAEFAREMAELRAELARELGPDGELERELREMEVELRRELAAEGLARRDVQIAIAEGARASAEARAAAAAAPEVIHACRNPREPVTTEEKNGKTRIFICEKATKVIRREAISAARKAIEIDRNLSAEQRAEALKAVDEALAEDKVSFLRPVSLRFYAPVAPVKSEICPEERARLNRSA